MDDVIRRRLRDMIMRVYGVSQNQAEVMMDVMEIDALAYCIHNVDKVYSTGKKSDADCRDAAESVLGADALPSVKPKKGRWFDVGSLSCRCDQCGLKNNKTTRFCPNCGAEMER